MDHPQTIDTRLARKLIADHPAEAGRLLEQLELQQALASLLMVEAEAAALVLGHMERTRSVACLAGWPRDRRPDLLGALDPSLAARLLRGLDAAGREALLADAPKRVADLIRRLLRYPEESAGALMDPNPPAGPEDLSVDQARALLAQGSSHTRGYLYVVDRDQRLVGVIELDDLLQAPGDNTLGALKRAATARLPARADRSAINAHPGWREHHALPVVDRNEVLVGVVDHRALHELEAPSAARGAEPPLGLAVGEIYWALMSALVEGVMRSVRPRSPQPEQQVRP